MVRKLYNFLIVILLAFLFTATSFAQFQSATVSREDFYSTFRFRPDEEVFDISYRGNDMELSRLYSEIDRSEAGSSGKSIQLTIDSYSSSQSGEQENLGMAYLRANRVKSELISSKKLSERQFVVRNFAEAYRGQKDVIVLTLKLVQATPERVRVDSPVVQAEEKKEPVWQQEPERQPEPVREPEPQPDSIITEQTPVTDKKIEEPGGRWFYQNWGRQFDPELLIDKKASATNCLSLRTNLLYDVFLLPAIGVEWIIGTDWGIKLDGAYSFWGDESGSVQKILLVNPEVRRYLGEKRRFYLGAAVNYCRYNVYDFLIGNFLRDDTGSQGYFWSAGITTGYKLRLSDRLDLDFNVGFGYTSLNYDRFRIVDEVRFYKEKDQSEGSFFPIQAGISLAWKFEI